MINPTLVFKKDPVYGTLYCGIPDTQKIYEIDKITTGLVLRVQTHGDWNKFINNERFVDDDGKEFCLGLVKLQANFIQLINIL